MFPGILIIRNSNINVSILIANTLKHKMNLIYLIARPPGSKIIFKGIALFAINIFTNNTLKARNNFFS